MYQEQQTQCDMYRNEWLATIYRNEWLATIYRNEWLATIYRNEWLATIYRNEWLATIYYSYKILQNHMSILTFLTIKHWSKLSL